MIERKRRRFTCERRLLTNNQQAASDVRLALLRDCRFSVLRIGDLFAASDLAWRLSEVLREDPWITITKETR